MNDLSKISNDLKIGTKVFLDGECGVITDLKITDLSTIIRWDTPKENDFEDWCSMWGTFFKMGGRIIENHHQFKYINDDGSLKDKI